MDIAQRQIFVFAFQAISIQILILKEVIVIINKKHN